MGHFIYRLCVWSTDLETLAGITTEEGSDVGAVGTVWVDVEDAVDTALLAEDVTGGGEKGEEEKG